MISDPIGDVLAMNGAARPTDDPIGDVLAIGRQQSRATAISSLDTNPDQYAGLLGLAKQTGLPVGAIETDPDTVRRDRQLSQWDDLAVSSPALAEWLAAGDNAKVAHDDLESLSALEAAWKVARPFVPGYSGGTDAGNMIVGTAAETIGSAIEGLTALPARMDRRVGAAVEKYTGAQFDDPRSIAGHTPSEWLERGGKSLFRPVTEFGQELKPKDAGFALDTVGALTQLGLYYGVGALTGGLGVATLGAGQGAGQMAQRAEQFGADQAETDAAAMGGAIVTSVSEALGFKWLTRVLPAPIKAQLATRVGDIVASAGGEAAQEYFEGVLQNVTARLTFDPKADILTTPGQSGEAEAGVAAAIVRTLFHIRDRSDAAERARSEQGTLDAMVDAAGRSVLRERLPERFEELVASLKQSGAETVYIPAEAATAYFQSIGEDPLPLLSAAGVDEAGYLKAIATGGDIAVPVEGYLSRLAKDHHAGLRDGARLTAGGMTPKEASDEDSATAAAVERFQASLSESEAASDRRVYDDVFGTMLGTGRYQRQDIEKYATLMQAGFRTMATGEGIDPYDLYSRYRLRIKNELPAVLQAAKIDTVVDPIIEALRSGKFPTEREARGPDLIASLIAAGGIREQSGELRALGANRRPGLVSKKGIPLDKLPAWLYDNGYLDRPPTEYLAEFDDSAPDANTALEMIESALSGKFIASTRGGDKKSAGFRDAVLAMDEELGRRGIDVKAASNADIKRVLFEDEQSTRSLVSVFQQSEGDITETPEFNQSDQISDSIKRGYIEFTEDRQFTIGLLEKANLSTFLHETGHFFLEVMGDLASADGASDRIRNDYTAALNWLGAESREQITTRHHEKWARGFERYLHEGKAPTAELAGSFARFKAWLKSIYRSLTAHRVELTDEVRAVFDRMLATDAEINKAEREMDYAPLFNEAKRFGMTKAGFAAYQKLTEDAVTDGENRLMAKAMSEISREQKAWWTERRAEVRLDVAADVHRMPVYRAWYFLAFGRQPDGSPLPDGVESAKLSKEWLLRAYGQEFLNQHLLRRRLYTQTGGIDPDIAATLFGFESGDAMVQALANVQPMRAVIDAHTDQLMKEKYGDMLTDGSLPEEAMRAVHNSKRMKALEAEAETLEKITGEPAQSAKQTRQIAEAIIRDMTPRTIQPNSYLRAERLAAQRAQKAAARDNFAEALVAKRQQLINAQLYDLAMRAKDEAEAIQTYAKKFAKKALRQRLGKIGRLDQVDALLDGYDLRRISMKAAERNAAKKELLDAIDAGVLIAPRELIDSLRADGTRTNWADLPMEHLRGLKDTLRQIEADAKNEYRAYVNGQHVQLAPIIESLAKGARTNGKQLALIHGRETPDEMVQRYGRQALATWQRPQSMARTLDGGNDWGAWTRNLIVPVDRAITEKLLPMREKATDDLSKLYSDHFSVSQMAAMNIRKRISGINLDLSRWDLIAMGLNYGNLDGRKALVDSSFAGAEKKLTLPGIAEALNQLDSREWDFIEAVWTYENSYWPAIEEAMKRRKGVAPPKIEAAPFVVTLPDGSQRTISGGYHPLSYNGDLDAKARRQQEDDRYAQMTSGMPGSAILKYSHTQARIGSGGRPVLLSMQVLHSHIDDVVSDLAMSEAVAYADRLLQNSEVRAAMIATGNLERLKGLELWLKDVAVGEMGARSGAEQVAKFFRLNFSKSKLLFNMVSAARQIAGVVQSIPVVGPKWFAIAVKDYAKNRSAAVRQVLDQSAFMRAQFELNQFNRETADIQSALNGGAPGLAGKGWVGGFITAARAVQLPAPLVYWGFSLIRVAQLQSSTVTWLAGYNRGKTEKGLAHDQAVLYADSLVKNAQSSGQLGDRSALERGTLSDTTRQSEFVKLLTVFAGPMIAKGNIAYESAQRTNFKNVGQALSFSTDMFLLFSIEPLLMAAFLGAWPDDDEGWLWWLGKQSASQVAGTIPIVSEAPSQFRGYGTTSGPMGSAIKALAGAYTQSAQFAGDGDQSGKIDPALLKAYSDVIGVSTGAPSAQTNRLIDAYWRENFNGEDVPAYEYIIGERKQ